MCPRIFGERLRPRGCPSASPCSQGEAGCSQPAPERTLVASSHHTFADLALAIDEVFGCLELGSLREFTLQDSSRISDLADGGRSRRSFDYRRTRLQRLQGGEHFGYIFDAGDRWEHGCLLIGAIDLDEVLPDRPGHPVAYEAVGRRTPPGRSCVTGSR